MVEAGPLYVEANSESSVAICTLSSHQLLRSLAASPIAQQVAIIGPLETENIGIERIALTLLARPRIRWLLVCGDEARGRYQGQALRCLFDYGIGPQGQILRARSKRARLATLSNDHVQALRGQVELLDLIGVDSLDRIRLVVDQCRLQGRGPVESVSLPPQVEAVAVPHRSYRLTERDPQGYFVIFVDAANHRLLLEHYGNDGALRHRLAGPDAESLSTALVEGELVSRLDHAAYLGRELAKAELGLRYGLTYRQDEPLELEAVVE